MGVALPPFQNLIDAHWRDVARLAYALAGPADADDVAQQAWARALTAYPSLRSSANLRGWLLTVVAHCATDAHRARGRRAVPVPSVPDRAAFPVERAEPATRDDPLWVAVRSLPDRQRTALALRYVADLDHARIAEMLGTTSAATRRLVADGLATLRTKLEVRP